MGLVTESPKPVAAAVDILGELPLKYAQVPVFSGAGATVCRIDPGFEMIVPVVIDDVVRPGKVVWGLEP